MASLLALAVPPALLVLLRAADRSDVRPWPEPAASAPQALSVPVERQ